MAFTRILLAFLAVTGLFLAWRGIERRIRGGSGEAATAARTALPALVVEACLLTLFAGLWFGSLGAGGTPLLFLLIGALMEIPSRLRTQPLGMLPWRPVTGGIVRILLAGLLLGLVLG